ncbi:DNA polymerase-3 subunit gamma/tau [Desulfonatronum thiosulfatophilum]|uniref:DNA polymerase III subunit gamma/tau n=1 Tax=Desulfonatronum thiosulfatophilum TaxID=617002 RepID=A0A1G6C1X6_9BACT|nr:DNA polymerase III subunit gamma/tau [Desulfonatronum thiosulfatophilum]SDB26818.1 DNA polymerase-3 subunit gamma/tau [Desulfonatronum thiosulfatophilum]
MSHIQLTAKHRPQTFAQVCGQEDIRAILSRASVQDRVAAAYLFSGTRGVGKTTLARIFAKAINCVTAPTSEPCNQCHHCRQITAGSAVDVAEIDGASNRGIEQARRLKEDVGYAPLECRYKVIIIDEAHMLTRDAFNALLKTMEEPPPGVTFIMATTEPHKFPATIISRSQHYVFKMLPQAQLQAHLQRILELEGREFEPAATALLARRAAGSVRDAMSLLEQVLTISDQSLRLEDVRRILGLAGGELFQRLIHAMRTQDCLDVHDVLKVLLNQGLDLGFFLRELAGLWRNLFLLRQIGEKALPLLELPDEEGRAWLTVASELSPTYIHAAWQITLEAQRKVLNSLEPAQSLEMLLLNLTYLPQLVSLEELQHDPGDQRAAREVAGPLQAGMARQAQTQPPKHIPDRQNQWPAVADPRHPAPPAQPGMSLPDQAPKQSTVEYPSAGGANEPPVSVHESVPQAGKQTEPAGQDTSPVAALADVSSSAKTWEGFLEHYDRLCRSNQACLPGLRQVKCSQSQNRLTLRCAHRVLYDGLSDPAKWRILENLVHEYYGAPIKLELVPPDAPQATKQARESISPEAHPLVNEFVEQLKAKVVSVEPRTHYNQKQ